MEQTVCFGFLEEIFASTTIAAKGGVRGGERAGYQLILSRSHSVDTFQFMPTRTILMTSSIKDECRHPSLGKRVGRGECMQDSRCRAVARFTHLI